MSQSTFSKEETMNKLIVVLVALACVAALIIGCSSSPTKRIGTYDSRAIAFAFWGSNEGMEFITSRSADWTKAKAAKNDSLIRHMERTAAAQQQLLHLCGFSVGSVADILEKHKAQVDSVARAVGVRIIVSKFELILTGTGVDTVDVTVPLARIFITPGQVRNWVSQTPTQKPIPMLEALAIPPEK
jgi:type IV pilus biogenesis protein CpaD/CtpE